MECGWIRCLRGLSWGRKVPSDWWQGTGSESFLVEIKFGAQDSSHGSESFLLWLIKHPHLDHNNGTTLSQRFCDCLIYIVLIWRTKDEGYSKIVGRVSKRETGGRKKKKLNVWDYVSSVTGWKRNVIIGVNKKDGWRWRRRCSGRWMEEGKQQDVELNSEEKVLETVRKKKIRRLTSPEVLHVFFSSKKDARQSEYYRTF